MKGKRIIKTLLSLSLLVCLLSGCKTSNLESDESNLPVITLGSDNYPPYNYLNEDGNPTGIDVDLQPKRLSDWDTELKWFILIGKRIRNF